jgi:hypothetical protein
MATWHLAGACLLGDVAWLPHALLSCGGGGGGVVMAAVVSGLVFASSVQSGFLPPKRATVDRNRSRTDPHIAGTEPDHLGPVYFGPWD